MFLRGFISGFKIEKEYREKIINSVFVAAFFSLTVFLFAPANLYFTNVLEFPFYFHEILPVLLVLCLISTMTAVGILFLLSSKSSVYQKAVSIVFILTILLWIQGNIFVWHYGVFDGRKIEWERHLLKGFIELFVWVLLLCAAVIKSKALYKFVKKISIFFILVQLIWTVTAMVKAPKQGFKKYVIDENGKFDFRSKNIIILVLDSFQSDIFQEIIEEDNYYRDIFEDFTYFRNALAGFPTTYLSVTMFLTGRYYDNSLPIQEFIKEAFLSSSSLPKVLKNSGFNVDLFPDHPFEIYCDKTVASNIVERGRSIIKISPRTLYNIYTLSFFRYSPHFLKKYFYEHNLQFFQKTFVKIKNTSLPSHGTKDDLRFIEDIESKSKVVGEGYGFKFFHLWGLHPPFVLTENLEYIELPSEDRGNAKRQGKGLLQLVKKFLDTLKRNGIYDSSMIFIIGDHGLGFEVKIAADLPTAYAPERNLLLQEVKGSAIPLILVKPFGSRGKLKISDAPVCLSDIPKTIASELKLKGEFPGIAMLENKEPVERKRVFLMYSWQHKYFDEDYLPTMEEYIIRGHSWFDESWKKSGKKFIPLR